MPYGARLYGEHGRDDMIPGSLALSHTEGKPLEARRRGRVLATCLLLVGLCLPASSTSLARRKPPPPSGADLMLLGLPDLYQMASESDSTVLATVKQLTYNNSFLFYFYICLNTF